MDASSKTIIDFTKYVADRTRDFTGRGWVYEAINDWLEDAGGSRVFLLTGEPGSGKTAIASRLYQFSLGLRSPDGLAGLTSSFLSAVHFCSARERHWISPHVFSRSLAVQLAGHYPPYTEALVESSGDGTIRIEVKPHIGTVTGGQVTGVVIENLNVSGVPAEDAFIRVVREPLEALFRTGFDQQVVILVDALDEALFYSGEAGIVPLLAQAQNLPAGVRFILTSRPMPEVLRPLRRFSPDLEERSLTTGEELARSLDDVEQHVRHWLTDNPQLAGRLAQNVSSDDFAQAVRKKSDGNFLYVTYLLQMLTTQQAVIGQEYLNELPAGLDGIYVEFLERLVGDDDEAWQDKYAPVIGTLAVARQALTEEQLAQFLSMSKSQVRQALTALWQLLEVDNSLLASERTYTIYHHSLADFLLDENRAEEYWCEAREQHNRVVEYYLTKAREEWQGDWSKCDRYGLRYLVDHMQARLTVDRISEGQALQVAELYAVVLDDEFREAKYRVLGDVHAALDDLLAVLEIALARDDLVKVLESSGVYRDSIGSQSVTRAIFEAVQKGDFERAIEQASHYMVMSRPRGYWARVLLLYLAWQAAEQGDVEAVRRAMASTEHVNYRWGSELHDALLVRTARALGRTTSDASSVRAWLGELHPTGNLDRLLTTYDLAQPLPSDRRQSLVGPLNNHVAAFERLVGGRPYSQGGSSYDFSYEEILDDLPYEEVVDEIFPGIFGHLDEEMLTRTYDLQEILVELAATDEGQASIDALLRLILPNPYPRYRDISLVTLGVASLAVPASSWAHLRLQRILETTLNQEGATFTFDLPSILLEEAKKRQVPAQQLSEYLNEALGRDDGWGTAARAHSAHAAALFRQGKTAEALEALQAIGRNLLGGYSGYRTLTLLSLVNRCYEFGEPGLALAAIWMSSDEEYEETSLFDAAERAAESVRDWHFREERLKLVSDHREWGWRATPDLDSALATLSEIADPDTRRIYVDHATARWASLSKDNREWVKKLVPMVLADPTALDAVLGRLLGLSLDELANGDLAQAINLCAAYFMDKGAAKV